MLSQFVSAARGLFGSNNNPQASSSQTPDSISQNNAGTEKSQKITGKPRTPRSRSPVTKKDKSRMVITRQTTFDAAPTESPAAAQSNRSGKKRTQEKTPKTPKTSKGKKQQLQQESDGENQTTSTSPVKNNKEEKKDEKDMAKSSHVRFGSEEPEAEPAQEDAQSEPESNAAAEQNQDSDDSSSDDEAPEAVGKDTAMEKLREASRKEAEAKKRLEDQKREKRRERDQRLKSQAIKKATQVRSEKEQQNLLNDDDDDANDHSASSSTLHGSTSNAHFKASLPALLPDDILNAEPTPFNIPAALALEMEREQDYTKTKPTKRKFLEEYEQEQKKSKTKVIERGGNRYLVAGKESTGLAPRASKGSGNVKQRWLSQDRKGIAGATGLRRTAPKAGFVRR